MRRSSAVTSLASCLQRRASTGSNGAQPERRRRSAAGGGPKAARPSLAAFPLAALLLAAAAVPACAQTFLPNWTQVDTAEINGPSGRYGAAMAYDAKTGTVVLFGGARTLSCPTTCGPGME